MEPFIRFRLLSAELNESETDKLARKIVDSFGAEQIISSIFSGFMHEYKMKNAHNDRLQIMINMASNIINLRKKKEKELIEKKDEESEPIAFDALPYELIGECASYLKQKDYFDLSIANRKVYCATNSPNRLKELNLTKSWDYCKIHLSRFSPLKGLSICPDDFNNFADSPASDIDQITFSRLKKLSLNHNGSIDDSDIEILIDYEYIPFEQITKLTLEHFGTNEDLYDFDSFCVLLSHFPNVTDLELVSIHLTDFDEENEDIATTLPNLIGLNCYNLGFNESAMWLRDKLLSVHSKQLVMIKYDGYDEEIGTDSLVGLKYVAAANADTSKLKQICESSRASLEHVNMGQVDDSAEVKESIVSLLTSFPKLKTICMLATKEDVPNVVSFVEIGLMRSKNIERESVVIGIAIGNIDGDENVTISMEDIELATNRIVNALNGTDTKNWRFVFFFPTKVDRNNDRYKICSNLSRLCLSDAREEPDGDGDVGIIISNKDCNLCGGYDVFSL